MSIAFVCGNGQSRRVVELEHLRPHGSIYGCNAMYRDFVPDCLVATDRPIAQKIQESGYSAKHRFYTRKPMHGLGAFKAPEKYQGNSSGPLAVSIAASDGHKIIYLLGFDMGPTSNQKFNNIYAGTEFYKKLEDVPTYTGNWINQIKQLAKDFPTCTFVRVVGDTTAEINDIRAISNMIHMPMSDFLARMQTSQLNEPLPVK